MGQVRNGRGASRDADQVGFVAMQSDLDLAQELSDGDRGGAAIKGLAASLRGR